MKKKIILALLAILVVMQFFGSHPEQSPVVLEEDFIRITQPTEEVAKLLKTACYDCHSHETTFPWYSHVAPLSWWINHHVEEGNEHLNFSTWGKYSPKKADHKLEECVEEVEEGEMPMKPYTITHGDANLTQEQIALLSDFFSGLRKTQE